MPQRDVKSGGDVPLRPRGWSSLEKGFHRIPLLLSDGIEELLNLRTTFSDGIVPVSL